MTSTLLKGTILSSQEDIIYRLCKQPFSSPKLLTCLHSFCQLCIEERLTTDGGDHVFQCPLCKHQTRLQTKSASSLTTNFYVLGRQRVYACRASKASGCVVCSMKGDFSDSTHHCLDCGDKLCKTCSTGHNSSTLTATHRVVSLDELKEGHYDRHLLQREERICEKHCEGLAIFCQTCSEALCVQCVVAEHTEHQFETVGETVEKRRQSMKQALTMVVATSSNIQDSANTLQAEIDQLNKEEEIFVSDLTSSVEAVMEKIGEKSSEVLEKGRRSFEDERMKRQRMLELMNSESERREEIVSVCRQVEEGDDLTLLLMCKTLNEGLKGVTMFKQFTKAVDNVSAREPLTKFKMDISLPLDTEFLTLGEISVTGDHLPLSSPMPYVNVSRTLEPGSAKESDDLPNSDFKRLTSNLPGAGSGKVETRTPSRRAVSDPSEHRQQRDVEHPQTSKPVVTGHNGHVHESTCPSVLEQELVVDTTSEERSEKNDGVEEVDNEAQYMVYKRQFSVHIGTDRSQTMLSCMALRPNGTLQVLDEPNTKLKVFKTNGQFVYSVLQKGKCQLFKQFVHFGDGDKIFAIYENNLLILTRHLKIVSEQLLMQKQDMVCEPIVANFGEHILIGNLPHREMRVMTTSGKVIRKWSSQVTGEMTSLRHVADDAVISCTWEGKGAVCLESEEDGCLLKINGRKRNGMNWRPSHAIFGIKGQTIVSDMHRNDILIFSPRGKALCVVDTLQHHLSQPNCLLLGDGGNVYVSCKDGVIAVYELQ
ncbi:E3 ubiquitin-protein ligase TRIM56-like [Haliotis cracherodii]|uniref:E3 ubiquitin-protein ligase TRIM56-like n=1 Tax=Haliotis cracherodii TaxID=6455 RepID=UPI0039E9AEDF